MTISKILSIAVLLLSSLISHVTAFQQPSVGVGRNVGRVRSSSLNMAPKFDKATQKWFPSNPEVTSVFFAKEEIVCNIVFMLLWNYIVLNTCWCNCCTSLSFIHSYPKYCIHMILFIYAYIIDGRSSSRI